MNRNDGYGLIGAASIIYLGIALCKIHYQHRLYRTITIFRGAVVSLIYAKTLTRRAGIYDESAALTLMSTDVDRIVFGLQQITEIWARLIEIAIGIWLLKIQSGLDLRFSGYCCCRLCIWLYQTRQSYRPGTKIVGWRCSA